jgi:hypothetical protein
MRTVTLRLSGEDFSTAIVRMRDWLKKNRCEPTRYRYDQDEDTVMLSVDFAADAQAKAFLKCFGDQSATEDL